MTGLMLKDLYEVFCLKKYVISWILNIVCILISVVVLQNSYVYILCAAVVLPMIGVSVLQASIEQDEISKYDRIMLTYPITKKEIILSKYLSGMVLQAMIFLVNFLLALLFSFGYKVIDFPTAMGVWFVGVIFSFIYMAINYMMFFWLGNKIGSILYFIFIGAVAIIYVITYVNIDIDAMLNMNKTMVMVIGFVISILSLIGSYYASIKIYTKKHIK